MRIDRFQMERTQSLYEHDVEYNLSESGVQPLTVTELLGEELDATALGALALRYPESNGSPLLRERIATFYPGAARENVLVTTGGSEANYTTLWGLLDEGARAAVMIPNYMQSWGLARAFGDRDLGKFAGIGGIADIHERGAVRRLHMPDIGNTVANHDLSATGAVEISDDLQPLRCRHRTLRSHTNTTLKRSNR